MTQAQWLYEILQNVDPKIISLIFVACMLLTWYLCNSYCRKSYEVRLKASDSLKSEAELHKEWVDLSVVCGLWTVDGTIQRTTD